MVYVYKMIWGYHYFWKHPNLQWGVFLCLSERSKLQAAIFFLIFSHRKYVLRSGASEARETPGSWSEIWGKVLVVIIAITIHKSYDKHHKVIDQQNHIEEWSNSWPAPILIYRTPFTILREKNEPPTARATPPEAGSSEKAWGYIQSHGITKSIAQNMHLKHTVMVQKSQTTVKPC